MHTLLVGMGGLLTSRSSGDSQVPRPDWRLSSPFRRSDAVKTTLPKRRIIARMGLLLPLRPVLQLRPTCRSSCSRAGWYSASLGGEIPPMVSGPGVGGRFIGLRSSLLLDGIRQVSFLLPEIGLWAPVHALIVLE